MSRCYQSCSKSKSPRLAQPPPRLLKLSRAETVFFTVFYGPYTHPWYTRSLQTVPPLICTQTCTQRPGWATLVARLAVWGGFTGLEEMQHLSSLWEGLQINTLLSGFGPTDRPTSPGQRHMAPPALSHAQTQIPVQAHAHSTKRACRRLT